MTFMPTTDDSDVMGNVIAAMTARRSAAMVILLQQTDLYPHLIICHAQTQLKSTSPRRRAWLTAQRFRARTR
jgi:hypothetical protein